MYLRIALVLCIAMLTGIAAADNVASVAYPTDRGIMLTPLDDPQPDTLQYDNNTPALLNTATNFWVWTRFTTPAAFELRSVYFQTINGSANATPCSVFVYTPNGNSPGALLGSAVLAGTVPDFEWNDVNLTAPVQFEANTDFVIVIGPNPGGQQAQGWHVLMDNANTNQRSRIVVGNRMGSYSAAGGDYMIRAGGAVEAFTDLGGRNTWLTTQQNRSAFNVLPGTRVRMHTEVANLGAAEVDAYTIRWVVVGPDGGTVFDQEISDGPVPVDGTDIADADSFFTAADAGEYLVTATITADGDAVGENNTSMLRFFAGNNGRWYRYDDNEAPDSYVGFSEGNGWGVAFFPVQYTAQVESLRVAVGGAGQGDFRIYRNGSDGAPAGDPVWSATPTVAQGWNTLIVNPPVRLTTGQSFTVAYLYSGVGLGTDEDPPNAGEILEMATVSWQASSDGATWAPDISGNWCLQAFIDSVASAVELPNANMPATFVLSQNYPNPFNPTTDIEFSVPRVSEVRIAVYNLLGQEVRVLENGTFAAGLYRTSFDAKNLPAGLYFYRMEAGDFTSIRKMMLVK